MHRRLILTGAVAFAACPVVAAPEPSIEDQIKRHAEELARLMTLADSKQRSYRVSGIDIENGFCLVSSPPV